MRINKLFAVLAIGLVVFTACEKEEEPFIVNSIFFGLQQEEYLEGDTVKFRNVFLIVNWSDNSYDRYNFNDFEKYGIETIPNKGEEISLSQDSVFIVFKELGIKEGVPINVIESKVSDYDGNIYNVIKIHDQYWLDKNMATTHYSDGTPIPTIIDTNGNGTSEDEWHILDPNAIAYCYYGDNIENKKYGALYTWAAAMGEGLEVNQDVCPEGFHVPIFDEWNIMFSKVLNDYRLDLFVGKALKAQEGWGNNGNGTDFFKFSALPAGMRDFDRGYKEITSVTYWWTATQNGENDVSYTRIGSGLGDCWLYYLGITTNNALSVRCIKDTKASTKE